MNQKTHIPKLAAPARDETALQAALHAGADAVYIGLEGLNMRLKAPGLPLGRLPEAVNRAHAAGAELFVTLNAIAYDHEMDLLNRLLDGVEAARADAVICWDPAVIQGARERNLAFHLSTQASVSNLAAARFWEGQGASAMVLARELDLSQIAHIKRHTQALIEVFCHGAMCLSVSGRCFLSLFLENRSGNRGECWQPCRREYTLIDDTRNKSLKIGPNYLLSPKDLCSLGFLEEIVAAGVDILKIEGRMRAPEYVSVITTAYRRALEAIGRGEYTCQLKQALIKEADTVFHRGFSAGFFLGRPASEGWSPRPDNQASEIKTLIGRVANYFRQAGAVMMENPAKAPAAGQTLLIQGPETGVVRLTIEELRHHPEADAFTFPCAQRVRRGDHVFLVEPRPRRA